MAKVAWSNEQDNTLGEVVVREVKLGKQLQEAFGTAADELNILFETSRNAGSVGTRWYAEVAKNFSSQIEGKITMNGKTIWSPMEDQTLAYALFEFYKKGKTRKQAMEFVSEQLGRTYYGTVARWTDVLSKGHYGDLYNRLKNGEEVEFIPERIVVKKGSQDVQAANEEPKVVQAVGQQPINEIIGQLNGYLNSIQNEKSILTMENQELKSQMAELQSQVKDYNELKVNNETLQSQLTQRTQEFIKLQEEFKSLHDDYNAYLRLMERARKLTVQEEAGPLESQRTRFKMDQNGNLERI